MIVEYVNILIFAFFAFLITFVLILLNYFFTLQQPNNEKNSAYECGFEPFNFPLEQFEIKYYLVALMFLIFDLELIFILP
jgi:NADH-quinone oxidoreductase subunit A